MATGLGACPQTRWPAISAGVRPPTKSGDTINPGTLHSFVLPAGFARLTSRSLPCPRAAKAGFQFCHETVRSQWPSGAFARADRGQCVICNRLIWKIHPVRKAAEQRWDPSFSAISARLFGVLLRVGLRQAQAERVVQAERGLRQAQAERVVQAARCLRQAQAERVVQAARARRGRGRVCGRCAGVAPPPQPLP